MNRFAKQHPFVLFVYFLSVLLVAVLVWNPILQATALLGGACFLLLLQPGKESLRDLGFYLPFFALVAVTNPLFSHNGVTPLFFLNGNPVTLEAFLYGLAIAGLTVAALLWCRCYTAVMSSDKVLYLFGKVLPKLSLVLSMALRFLPLFKRRMRQVKSSLRAMGLYSADSYVERVRGTLRVFRGTVAWSLENAVETADAMRARGYGLPGRSHFSLFRFRAADGWLLASNLFLLALTLAGVAFGETAFRYYPRVSRLRFTPFSVAVYLAFGLLCFLPFLLEVVENLRFRRARGKIK